MLEPLEVRQLLAAVTPSDLEQYSIELINRARANPAGEAAQFAIDLNEGLAAGTISPTSKQPLAVNPYLTDAGRRHSQWMLDTDTFSHTGINGTSPGDRQAAAGYVFSGTWMWGENLAWRGNTPGVPDPGATTTQLHEDLFVDTGYPGRGHRVDMLEPAFKEVGVGIATGVFSSSGTDYNTVMASQEFAFSGNAVFLTGVAYSDTVNPNDFYTPGEGLGGVTITATRLSDNAVFTTSSYASGGYSLALPAGTYKVMADGAGLPGTVGYQSVTISAENVKRDFTPDLPVSDVTVPTASLSAGSVNSGGASSYSFTVTYSDNVAIDAGTLNGSDIIVSGPESFSAPAALVQVNVGGNGTPRTATYRITPPGGSWDRGDNGTYSIALQANEVADTSANAVPGAMLGSFAVNVPAPATISVSVGDSTLAEAGLSSGSFVLQRSGSTGTTLTVFYSLGGSAGNGTDYQSLSGQATFGVGAATASVTIVPIDDGSFEPDETVTLTVKGNSAYSVDASASAATLTLRDNDPALLITRGTVLAGADASSPPTVRGFVDGVQRFSFDAYGHGFEGGVRVAAGDVTGDGVADIITAPGVGGGPHVRVIDGASGESAAGAVGNFFAYDPGYFGGIFVAAGDVNGDGRADIVTGTEAGPPHVKIFSGADGSLLASYYAFDPAFLGGVRVAAGDTNGDGRADVVTAAGSGAGPHVKVFSSSDTTLLASFFAFDPAFRGGVYVAAGDYDGDGQADVIVGANGAPHVKAFSGRTGSLLASFFAYDPAFRGGVRVATRDVNGDGRDEIITAAGPGAGPHVRAWGASLIDSVESFFADDVGNTGGVFVG